MSSSANISEYFAGEEHQPPIGPKPDPVVKSNSYRNLTHVKFHRASEKPPISKTNYRSAQKFMQEIDNTPVYFLNGHACICDTTGICYGSKMEPFFPIPENTYLLTFGSPPDFSCISEQNIPLLRTQLHEFKSFLWLHSASDMLAAPEIGTTKFSLFSDLRRAAQRPDGTIIYPNINYTFNNDAEVKDRNPKKNPYGVYRLEQIGDPNEPVNNTQSIIPQNDSRPDWYLADIIGEVYARTGIPKGIFINGGCLASCTLTQSGPHLDEAAHRMNYAHSIYPTIRETVTDEEISAVNSKRIKPRNIGVPLKFTYSNPEEVRKMIEAGLMDPVQAERFKLLYHIDNAPEMKKMATLKVGGRVKSNKKTRRVRKLKG